MTGRRSSGSTRLSSGPACRPAVPPRRAVLTGAQTGGHLYPALAVGRRLQALGLAVTLVASGAGVESAVLADAGIPVAVLKAPKWKGMSLARRVKGLASMPVSLARAVALVRRLRPDVVVGFGGYTSGPVVMAAALCRIPTAICEQNSIPGFTNRVLARFADRIFVAFEETERRFAGRPVTRTGTPVRPEILEVPEKTFEGEARRVLVLGGSQGSAFLNGRVPEVLSRVARRGLAIAVLHQTGEGRDAEVRAAYEAAGVAADVRPYLHDMAEAWRFADVVVCRSGAGTVSEVTAVGVPALFVPFAAAADNHQVFNARPVVEAGGAWMVEEREFDAGRVADLLAGVLADRQRLQAMSRACRALGYRDALDRMVAEVMEVAGAGGRAGKEVGGGQVGREGGRGWAGGP